MTCQTIRPPPPFCILTLPRARIRPQRPRAHCLPSPPLDIRLRAHKHTHALLFPALPIQTTDSGGSGRERGVSRAASQLTPSPAHPLSMHKLCNLVCVHLTIWSMVCVCLGLYYKGWGGEVIQHVEQTPVSVCRTFFFYTFPTIVEFNHFCVILAHKKVQFCNHFCTSESLRAGLSNMVALVNILQHLMYNQ